MSDGAKSGPDMTKAPAPMDHQRGKKKPVTKWVDIALDSELADEYLDAKRAFDRAQARADLSPQDSDAQREFLDARDVFEPLAEQMADNVQRYTFRSLGRPVFEDLASSHEATKDQREKARKEGQTVAWNPDTFPMALVAAACVDPPLSETDVKEMWESEDWNQAELLDLFSAAMEANTSRRTVDLGKGFGRTRP